MSSSNITTSIHEPLVGDFHCPHCGATFNADDAERVRYHLSDLHMWEVTDGRRELRYWLEACGRTANNA